MKLVLLLLAALSCTLAMTDQQHTKLLKLVTPCRKETGVSEEVLAKARNYQFEEDPKLKAYSLCCFRTLQLIDDNDDLASDQLKKLARLAASSEEEANRVHAKCTVKKEKPEETTYNAMKCFHMNLHEFSPVE